MKAPGSKEAGTLHAKLVKRPREVVQRRLATAFLLAD
jgi:hypothetical protein